jgi:hypothetical protein
MLCCRICVTWSVFNRRKIRFVRFIIHRFEYLHCNPSIPIQHDTTCHVSRSTCLLNVPTGHRARARLAHP